MEVGSRRIRSAGPSGMTNLNQRGAMKPTNCVQEFRNLLLLAVMFQLSSMGHALYAQVDTGAILGTVKDQSGAVVPGAKVSLTNEGTTFSVSTRTGVDGSYTFTPVKIGTYRVD